jgi:hypothetical protein
LDNEGENMSLFDSISSALTSQNNYQAQPANLDYSSYANAIQGSYAQQQQQNDQQSQLVNQLQQQANGTGPSVVQQQLADATAKVQNQAAGQIASTKGINPALASRMILQNQAAQGQTAAGQAATTKAQEQLSGQQQLASALQSQRAQNLQAYTGSGQLQNAQNQTNVQNTLGTNQINAGVSSQNAAANNATTSGLLSGVGAGLALKMNIGGQVQGQAQVNGDSEANDKVPAMLSPGEIVIPRSAASDSDKAKEFIDHIKKNKSSSSPRSGYAKVIAKQKDIDSRLKEIEAHLYGSKNV